MRLLALLFLTALLHAEMSLESEATLSVVGKATLFSWVMVDSVSGARILVISSAGGIASVVLPALPPPAPVTAAPPKPKVELAPDGMDRLDTWGDADAMARLAKVGWRVESVGGQVCQGLRLYHIIRPRLLPGQVEAPPMKGKP